MRILYFSRDYTPHDHRFLAAIAGSEHEVYYLRLEKRGPDREDRPLPPGVKRVAWKGGRGPVNGWDMFALVPDLKRVLREIRPDVVHAGPIQNAAFMVALSGFKPLVAMSWGYDMLIDAGKSAWMGWLTRAALRHAAVLIADNRAVVARAGDFGIESEQMVVFPWGVDTAHFSPGVAEEIRARRGWQDCFVLIHTRSWEPLYGVDTFVKAFTIAAQQRDDLRLLLLGTGSLSKAIRHNLQRAGVEPLVFYAGQVKYADLPDFYRAADLYASASKTDGSSVSLLEAMACGTPALVSDIPGNQEWVDLEVGAQFPLGDEQALAQAILQAADDRDQWQEKGKAARQFVLEKADWQHNSQLLFKAYQMAVQS
jgi:glycosyltransferase involved in cell wall biosynthesis